MQKILLDTDIGGAWLESAEKLTLHDPLAAAAVFHPELLRFARGFVRVAYLLREPQCAQRPHGRNGFHAGCRRKRGNCQIRG